MMAFWALWKREVIKFLFDRGRMGGALAQPLLFWLLLGLGFQGSFRLPENPELSFLTFLFPGMLLLVVVFTAIFSTVSIVEEKRSGFFQAALVAPISRWWLVLGNVAGGTTLGVMQSLLFLVMMPFVGIPFSLLGIATTLLICAILGLAFGSLGFVMAWRVQSTRGFLALMNFFLMPLWMLSGAFFPVSGIPEAVRWVVWLNPVTYGLDALRVALYGFGQPPVQTLMGFGPSFGVLIVFACIALAVARQVVLKTTIDHSS